jgi:hypothetical protein
MNGMTKLQSYIKLFGNGINFYGGLGEAAHKTFIKAAGQKTQRRVSEFAQQTAHQYYNMMLSTHAMQYVTVYSNRCEQAGTEYLEQQIDVDTDGDDIVTIHLSGQYEFEVTPEILEKNNTDDTAIGIVWWMGNSKKNNNRNFKLKRELVHCIYRKNSRVQCRDNKDCWSHKSHCHLPYNY